MGGGGNVSGEVKVFESREELSFQLGEWVRKTADAAIEERGKFALALGGQNIARLLFRELQKPNSMLYYQSVDWDKWYVFWPAKKKSTDTVLELGLLNFKKVFCKVDAESAKDTAADYEYKLRQQVRKGRVNVIPERDYSRFDLILLELGEDGQVASLLPDTSIMEDETAWVAPLSEDDDEICFTLNVINNAANVAVVAKASELDGADPDELISPVEGELTWFVDDTASAGLRGGPSDGLV